MQLQTLFAEVLPNNRLPAQQVTSVTCDSRQVQKGSVFVCIRGTLGDGHNYVAQALQRGAVFVVAQQDCKIPNQLLVEDTRRVYSQLCAAFFGYPARKMQLLALTGTNGKTTSAWMLHHALGHLGIKAGLIGTICNRIGESLTLPARYTTPDAWELQQLLAMMFKQGCTHVVMEASSQAIEQQRLYGCQFSCAAFLNLTPEHLDIHGDVEHYFQSKAMLFEQCDRALVRIDDPYAKRLFQDLQGKRMPLLTFGREQQAMLRAEQIQLFSDRCESTLCFQGEHRQAKLPLPGEFSVENLMAAVGMLLQLGLPFAESVDAVCSCQGVPGRTEVCVSSGGITVLRDYAHTPDSLRKVLRAIRKDCEGRLLVVFGCPGRRDRSKRPLMTQAVCENADLVVMTADNPREEPLEQIFSDALADVRAGWQLRVIPDRAEAIHWAISCCRRGDVLLRAGKGHENYQVLADRTILFDEKQLVRQEFERRKTES